MRAAGGEAFLIAKIERAEAVEPKALIDIMSACEGIMVARGDLAVEVGDASVPALQKRMIRLAREQNKLTITATQMMESMISSPVPTRAEVSTSPMPGLMGPMRVMMSAKPQAAITLSDHRLDEPHLRSRGGLGRGDASTATSRSRLYREWTSRSPWRRFLPPIISR